MKIRYTLRNEASEYQTYIVPDRCPLGKGDCGRIRGVSLLGVEWLRFCCEYLKDVNTQEGEVVCDCHNSVGFMKEEK